MVAVRGMTPELRDARRRGSLLQTEGTAWDVAAAAAFLASDSARWITGVVLPVDAGASARGCRRCRPARTVGPGFGRRPFLEGEDSHELARAR